MRRGFVVGVRVEDDAVTAQLGNRRHPAIVHRSPAVRQGLPRLTDATDWLADGPEPSYVRSDTHPRNVSP